MLWWLLTVHLAGIVLSAQIGQRQSMRAGLLLASVPPALTTLWAVGQLVSGPSLKVTEIQWVAGLDISLRFRVDAVSTMMTVLVSGIGALVFVYAVGYFGPTAKGGRFPSTLLAFSFSMLGLVWADSVWTLFIFWEFTSITSFLLVGYKNTDPDVLKAARRALMITGAGGLVLLAGLLVLTGQSGTPVLTDLGLVGGTPGAVAAALILIGAATKSAQVPFHVWLPGAMAAPTPVSAYLHSATMVKAGVLLVALLGSTMADVALWKTLGLTFGVASVLWGAIGALRQRDAKLILAWGTVSQLGLLITLFSVGTGKAVFAATAILLAHALFKAALFMVVGEIDVRTGTRDITELGGLSRSMPLAFVTATMAAMSMAGVPPLLGFAAKEAAVEAVLKLDGSEQLVVGLAVIGGSILTVAYTLRFLIGVFGPARAGVENTTVAPLRRALAVPSVILAGAGLVGFLAIGAVDHIVVSAATQFNEKADAYHLVAWPGFTPGLAISALIIAAGSAVGWLLAKRDLPVPRPLGARAADDLIDGVLAFAPRITRVVQPGSLPVYVLTMGAVMVLAAATFATGFTTDHLVWANTPMQAVLAAVIVVSAVAGAFVRSRLGAALTLGAVGIAISGLFVVQGAPDLVLTQVLVETIIVVGFVIGLGHLSQRFPRPSYAWRSIRLIVSVLGGVGVAVALAVSGAAPVGRAPVGELARESVDEGGGNNVVNVILTDMRGLDTLGEVVVLATVAIGILALAAASRSEETSA